MVDGRVRREDDGRARPVLRDGLPPGGSVATRHAEVDEPVALGDGGDRTGCSVVLEPNDDRADARRRDEGRDDDHAEPARTGGAGPGRFPRSHRASARVHIRYVEVIERTECVTEIVHLAPPRAGGAFDEPAPDARAPSPANTRGRSRPLGSGGLRTPTGSRPPVGWGSEIRARGPGPPPAP